MVEPTQKSITKALRLWAKLRGQRAEVEAERDQLLAPIRARFEQDSAPILQRFDPQISTLSSQISELEAGITKAMLAGTDERGEVKITRVDVACAVVEIVTRPEREIDTKAFFEAVPPHERGDVFWMCLKTLVGKAEKFLGDRVNEYCHAKYRHTVSLREKEAKK